MINISASKKIFSGLTAIGILAMFLFCPLSASADGTDGEFVEISDAAGLAALAKSPGGNYRLTDDIYLDSGWQPIPFSGKLDGAGHTVYNLHVTSESSDTRVTRDSDLNEHDSRFAGLFSVAEKAEVTDLNIKGAYVEIESKDNCFAAIFAGYSDNTVFRRCSVEGRVRLTNNGVDSGVGGFVGFGTGVFEKCNADVELVFKDSNTSELCDQFMGSMLACGIGSINLCKVKIAGYASCNGYIYSGAMTGLYSDLGTPFSNSRITNSNANGQINYYQGSRSKKAHCAQFNGSLRTHPERRENNKYSVKLIETMYNSNLLFPEKCNDPDYEETVIPSTCKNQGYTEHKCRNCEYSWIDSYKPLNHDETEWITVSDSDNEHGGIKRKYCKKCGILLGEEIIPPKSEKNLSDSFTRNTIWAVAASSGVLAILEILVLSRSRKKKRENIGANQDNSELKKRLSEGKDSGQKSILSDWKKDGQVRFLPDGKDSGQMNHLSDGKDSGQITIPPKNSKK